LIQYFIQKGSDTYQTLLSAVNKSGGFEKCSCIFTDNENYTTGINTGLVYLLMRSVIVVPVLHSITYQEALCGKFMKLNEVMRDVVKIINLIRGENRAQSDREVVYFLEEMSAECKDISCI
jgi:hypothetical protein